VKALLADPVVLRMQYAQGRGHPAVDVRAEQERVRLERKLTSLDREVIRLIDAYQAEVIDLSELAERRRRIEDQGRMLRERVREIDQQRTERNAELRLLEGVDAFCLSVQGAMETPSFAVQQKVLQLVVDRIVVEDRRVLIEHVVPTGPVRLQTEHPAAANPTTLLTPAPSRFSLLRNTVWLQMRPRSRAASWKRQGKIWVE
jgi:site-specific DNA recombinase